MGIDILDCQDHADATADGVLDMIENGDSQDGDDFGKDVADIASDENSTGGLDTETPDEDETARRRGRVPILIDGARAPTPGLLFMSGDSRFAGLPRRQRRRRG